MRILIWAGSSNDPSARFRMLQYVEPFRKRGHQVHVVVANPARNWTPTSKFKPFARLEQLYALWKRIAQVKSEMRNAKNYDIIFTNKDLLPNLKVTYLEKWIASINPNLVFDIDDAVYLGPRALKLQKIFPSYKALIAGSPILQAHIDKNYQIKTYYIPVGIDTSIYHKAKSRPAGKLRIGWSGSNDTNIYALPTLQTSLEELAKTIDFELIIISNTDPKINWKGVSHRFLMWTPESEVRNLQLFDIGLMPLNDDEFERGKCALKAVQYMAIGIPAVVSPVGVNQQIVDDGINGFHYRNDKELVNILTKLSQDQTLLREMGEKAYEKVQKNYSLDVLVPIYERVFKEIIES